MRKSEPFRFKQFQIFHHRCAHKVGTDGVLLGAWAPANSPKRILDIGTGSGLIALMLAQRFPQARITAIELDPASAAQAQENTASSPFAHVEVLQGDFLKYDFREHFDLIVSNPPFFQAVFSSGNEARDQARHESALPHQPFVEKCTSLLSPQGSLSVILPKEEGQSFVEKATSQGLTIAKRTRVFGAPSAPEKRWLLSCSLNAEQTEESKLVLRREDHSFSEDHIRLTEDFYLNL